MSTPVASIVIPSYNCADLLHRSVNSAFALRSDLVEVIVVDDASTDDTPEVCGHLKEQYPELRVIRHPVNGGLSVARNSGIEVANGDFIMLLDADDELEFFPIEILQKCNADLIRIGIREISTSGTEHLDAEDADTLSGVHFFSVRLKHPSILTGCSYVYRRGFLNLHRHRFIPRLIHEDIPFVIGALLKASSVVSTSNIVIRYFRRDDSITRNYSTAALVNRLNSLLRIIRLLISWANEHTELDLWHRAEHIVDNAWGLAAQAGTFEAALLVVRMELRLFAGYRQWGQYRSRRSTIWRIRRALSRLSMVGLASLKT